MNRLPNDHFQAQFTALKDQINPHFLFNSLSVLSSLVRKDPDLSEQFIEHLAKVYRYLLEQKDDELVPLSTELAFTQSYSFLLAVRFARKIRFDLPPELPGTPLRLLPFTLQMLIENAIRHNRMSVAEPLVLTVALATDTDLPVLRVTNNQQLRLVPDGETRRAGHTARGLTSIRERYLRLVGERVQVATSDERFEVCIPLLAGSSPAT